MRRAFKAAGLVVLGLLVLFIAYEAFALWRAKQRTPQVLAQASRGELRLSDLPKRRLAMLLKVEDPAFYRHPGVDFSTPGAGMTTITQGLVKRFYFKRFTKGFPKIEQSLIARFVLDPAMSKNRQLQAYLNFAYLGSNDGRPVIGYAAAARAYHGRDFAQLSDREFLSLLAMTIAPNTLDPVRHKAANDERVRRIEALLAGKCKPAGLRDVTYEACAQAAGPS
jgi:membrane carboxypeptidase/penicillin-binding protein